jgi:dihydroorotate dehydrogenase
MYSWIRPLLFRLDAEHAHHFTLNALRLAQALPFGLKLLRALFDDESTNQSVEAFGLAFKNRVGLAAGYDKNGVAIRGLGALGFGHIEVGTVTRQPQPGNPKPRVHRVPEAKGLVNSMGFPNEGVANLLLAIGYWRNSQPIANSQCPIRLGINIGKSKDTPIEKASEDYCALLQQVYEYADYVALNISSPNTMNLRQLQARDTIARLLSEIAAVRDGLALQPPPNPPPKKGRALPLLVKIAPDLNKAEIDDVLDAISLAGIDGIIATNTTVGREGLPSYAQSLKGGLSGAPLTAQSTEVIRYIHARTLGKLPIIGVGGIMSPQHAIDKINAGATLVQIYTGMIYYGPALTRDICRAIN